MRITHETTPDELVEIFKKYPGYVRGIVNVTYYNGSDEETMMTGKTLGHLIRNVKRKYSLLKQYIVDEDINSYGIQEYKDILVDEGEMSEEDAETLYEELTSYDDKHGEWTIDLI